MKIYKKNDRKQKSPKFMKNKNLKKSIENQNP